MAFSDQEPRDAHGRWTAGGAYDELTSTKLLDAPPTGKPGSKNIGEIARGLNARGQAALKALGVSSGQILTPKKGHAADPKETNILSSAIASEIESEMGRGGKTATNWYTAKVDEAMKIATLMHPEMQDNPVAKFGYTAALAITSQGETVPSNTRLADMAYSKFAATGKFPTNIESQNQGPMNNNFEKLNSLIDHLGMKGTIDFLNKEFTVKQLEQQGYKVNGENKATKVYGSAILGAKIGQGFYQNLNGNYKPLTADMWLMRSWGRLTGTLTGQVPTEKPQARFTQALKAAGQSVPKTEEGIRAKADEVLAAHEKDFLDNRAQYDSGEKKKSELAYAAERLDLAFNGVKSMPSSGGQRQHIRDVFAEAQSKLADAGHPMSIADMQATWWYPEKRLYAQMGGRASERINTDYASVLKDMALKKGIPQEKIDAAVRT